MHEHMTVIVSLEDGTEVWYQVDKLTVTPDPFGVGAVSARVVPGAPERPDGPYVQMHGARLFRIIAAEVGV